MIKHCTVNKASYSTLLMKRVFHIFVKQHQKFSAGDALQFMGKHTKKKQGNYSNEHKILYFTRQQELEASDEQQGLQ